MLAQIELTIRREEPALAHLLSHGTRATLLLHPEAATMRALLLTMATILVGISLFAAGLALPSVPLLVTGLALAIVGPLPTWLLATAQPRLVRVRA